ncbi:hypothetical protein ACN4EK_03065 [Pantanalinema rosaneae CENA516]|uniref:hypothetical protein n=1 Tax=Pantanalinema rosaneae TaxID=1620701 RepID=UPI003D6F16A1
MINSTDSHPPYPEYSVSIWEGLAIAVGAVMIAAVGTAGLFVRFFSNAVDPQRATAIADSLMEYTIPGGAQGVFGTNIGGAKVAIVSSPTFPRDFTNPPSDLNRVSGVELFVARVPLDIESPTRKAQADSEDETTLPSPDFTLSYRSGEDFKPLTSRTETKPFCDMNTLVLIQEGELTLTPELSPVYAVKYDAIVALADGKRMATVLAIGQDAKQQAATVFNSLRCQK